ncbi:MAG TPA: hypothetical protein VHN11_16560 [Xanthobacteraceae bacterium]|nr:hypothetical protein [Xanthobacteraceae bacterium]
MKRLCDIAWVSSPFLLGIAVGKTYDALSGLVVTFVWSGVVLAALLWDAEEVDYE